jgi:uncharacterized protein (DUF305 family)
MNAAAHAQEPAQSAIELPEVCRTAAQANGGDRAMQGMQGMQGSMSQGKESMQATMGEMTETQQGLRDAMMQMNGPMMQGMMNKDADVAWVCAMIPHHLGAVAMARAGLKGADNEESKRLAQKTIDDNEESAKELIDWVNEHAASESENETTGSTAQ